MLDKILQAILRLEAKVDALIDALAEDDLTLGVDLEGNELGKERDSTEGLG